MRVELDMDKLSGNLFIDLNQIQRSFDGALGIVDGPIDLCLEKREIRQDVNVIELSISIFIHF